MAESPKQNYIEGLHGLRAFAALAVFAAHYNQIVRLDVRLASFDLYRLLANGENGVALFIILSGFLLSQPFWRAIVSNEQHPGYSRFFLRRLLRIVPAYYVALVILVLPTGALQSGTARLDFLLHCIFLFNFTEFTIMSINPPFWTLAVEMQLYLLLPVIFLFIRRVSPGRQILFILIVIVLSYFVHFLFNSLITKVVVWPYQSWLIWIRPNGAVLSQSPLALTPHFLTGILIGKIYLLLKSVPSSNFREKQLTPEKLFWFILITLMLLLSCDFGEYFQLPYGRYGIPVVMTLIAGLIVFIPITGTVKDWFETFPLRWLGCISYSFYIYHYPCLHWLDRELMARGIDAQQYWGLFGVCGLFLSTVIAALSYYMIERPFLRLIR